MASASFLLSPRTNGSPEVSSGTLPTAADLRASTSSPLPVLCRDLVASSVDVGLQGGPAGIGTAARALEGLATVLGVPFQVPLGAVRVAALTTLMLLFGVHFHKVLGRTQKGRQWATASTQSVSDPTRTPELALSPQGRQHRGSLRERRSVPSHSCSGRNFLVPPCRCYRCAAGREGPPCVPQDPPADARGRISASLCQSYSTSSLLAGPPP